MLSLLLVLSVDFNRDVRPILSEHCYKCHGPAVKDVKGDLRLDDPASSTKARRDGLFAISPGHAADSMLLERVTSADAPMPPKDSGMVRLTPKQIEILKAWINEGAVYKPHWAFIPPADPVLPEVKDKKWARNETDRYVLAKLESMGMKPEAEADKPTLLRRASLALTGLQPTPTELDAFLKDKSPTAYEKQVDRLLASPRYGEHEARYWFDAVRYGDTHGLHIDNERSIYPYRDWVIRAFNEDLSFDKFTRWQLAGDLLPTPSTDQLIATGYIRMNPTTNEGGAIEDEVLAKNTFDRTETFSTIFLGLTVGCARCHDHKYDPLTQNEYFGLYAYFNSTADAPLDGNLLVPGPAIKARSPEQDVKARRFEGRMSSALAKIDASSARAWAQSIEIVAPTIGAWEVSDPFPGTNFDENFAKECGPEPGGLPDTAKWKPLVLKKGVNTSVVGRENASAFARGILTASKDMDLDLRIASDDAVKVWLNDKLIHDNKVLRGVADSVDTVRAHLVKGENRLLIKIINQGGPEGLILNFGDLVAERAAVLVKDPKGEKELNRLFIENGPATDLAKDYRSAKTGLDTMDKDIPMSLVATELAKPRPTHLLRRGEYNLKGAEVNRAIPKVLGNLPKFSPNNRLGLAEWLTSKNNPLFARVFVNRIWQQHFGIGLVRSAEDFGNQGEWPINPELLDYLAVRFAKDGYSMKKLHRLLVTSAAFRQDSGVSAAKLQKDPENRLASRGPRFRLDAEVIRDQALYASGLLTERFEGRGFRPYQPDGMWEALGFIVGNTARYVQDTDDSIYRRSLYLFWKRTSPHPIMLTFDAPMREACVVRRPRTNTPLQALVTMNETAFVEASRVFAERVMEEAKSDTDRISRAFKLAVSRPPSDAEVKVMGRALNRYRLKFKSNHAAAHELVSVGQSPRNPTISATEVAAWMMICNTITNTDEFLTLK